MILKNFVVFEGIDGAGTSTQLKILKDKLQNKNVFFTVEPTELPTGKFLRTILSGNVKVAPTTA
ncbi:MAG: dTMP kinase, partial [Spirochaetaceae bacterium]|nr:dTMP kinase [Spirochaetaceae bacterium]